MGFFRGTKKRLAKRNLGFIGPALADSGGRHVDPSNREDASSGKTNDHVGHVD
jgi:hypothetical protein